MKNIYTEYLKYTYSMVTVLFDNIIIVTYIFRTSCTILVYTVN